MSRKENTQHIEINQLVIDRMKQEKIPMDHIGTVLFVLFCLFEDKIELLDYADDSNRERRMQFLYIQLNRRDLIQKNEQNDNLWMLTARGNELVTYLKEQQGGVKKVKLKAETLQPLAEIEMDAECGGWIDDYVNLFPIVGKGERPLRVHPETCINKMNAFLKKYKYSKDTVLAATKMYIDDEGSRPEQYEYTSRADNFISKFADSHPNYASPLAAWCKRFEDEQNNPGREERFDTRGLEMV